MGVDGSIIEPPIWAFVCGGGDCVGMGGRVAGFTGGGEPAPPRPPKSMSRSFAALDAAPAPGVGSSKSMSEAAGAAYWEGTGLAAAA